MKDGMFITIWLAVAGFWDILWKYIEQGLPFMLLGIVFSFLKNVVLGERTWKQCFVTFVCGSFLCTFVGLVMLNQGVSVHTVLLTSAGTAYVAENLLRALLLLAEDLEKNLPNMVTQALNRWLHKLVGEEKVDRSHE